MGQEEGAKDERTEGFVGSPCACCCLGVMVGICDIQNPVAMAEVAGLSRMLGFCVSSFEGLAWEPNLTQ